MPSTVDSVDKCLGCPVREQFPKSTFIAPLLVPGNRIACAEAGGGQEALEGTPLVGASGSWLRGKEIEPGKRSGGLYRAAGVDPGTVSLCNVINCSIAADHKNVYPTDAEARSYIDKESAQAAQEHCVKNHVLPILSDSRFTRVDILGDKALRALTGLEGGILRWRGSPVTIPALCQWHEFKLSADGKSHIQETKTEAGEVSVEVLGPCKGPMAIPTLHPAFLARSQELMPAVVRDLSKTLDLLPEHYNLQPSLDDVKAFVATELAFDIETIRNTDEITMVGLCAASTYAMVVPFSGAYITELKRIFANATDVIGWNCIQFDLPKLAKQGVEISKECRVHDGMLEQHLLQPDLPHSLEFAGSFFLQRQAWKHTSHENELLYCAKDVDSTWQIHKQLRPMLRQEGLLKLYSEVQVPLAKICHLLTETGFRIDPARLKSVRADLESKSQTLEKELPLELQTREVPIRKRQLVEPFGSVLSEKTGKPLKYVMVDATELETPWKSSAQLQNWLYEICKLPVQTHVKTNERTSDKTAIPKLIRAASKPDYTKLVGEEQAAAVIKGLRVLQQLRQIASLLSTFLQDKWENAGVERIHSSFNVHGTASGRLSSSEINLQNLPTSARYIYVPSYSDWVIISSDFASLENRLTALLSQDLERLERLATPGYSEHKHNASILFDIPYSEVTKDPAGDSPYTKAKKVTHGLNYGEGPMKIAKINDLPFAEVKLLVDKWKAANPKTIAWQNETAARAKADGVLVTPFGRKRWFYTSSAHCVSPETLVLDADLRWVPVGSLKVGDFIVGFDEVNGGRGDGRKFRKSRVEATGRRRLPAYQIATDRGAVTASSDHGFLVKRRQSRGAPWKDVWVPARLLEPGDLIRYLGEPWVEDTTEEAGWLAGLLDGEGTLADYSVTFYQNAGEVLERAKKSFKDRGFKLTRENKRVNISPRTKKPTGKIGYAYIVAEENYQRMKLLGALRPSRLLAHAEETWNGRRISGRRPKYAKVLEKNFRGACEVVPLQTSSRTLITAGMLSHNTESLSFLPQSSAADILIRCMIALCYQRIGWPERKVQEVVQVYHPLPHPARLLVTVHDSFVLESPLNMVDEIRGILDKVLTQPWQQFGGYQFPIETGVGPSWGETH